MATKTTERIDRIEALLQRLVSQKSETKRTKSKEPEKVTLEPGQARILEQDKEGARYAEYMSNRGNPGTYFLPGLMGFSKGGEVYIGVNDKQSLEHVVRAFASAARLSLKIQG